MPQLTNENVLRNATYGVGEKNKLTAFASDRAGLHKIWPARAFVLWACGDVGGGGGNNVFEI